MRTFLATIALLAISLFGIAAEKGKAQAPFRRLPTYGLKGFMHQAIWSGNLEGKRINDLIKTADVVKAVVLQNETSAPDSLHLATIGRLLLQNPEIRSLWRKDAKTGAFQRSDKFDASRTFFSTLLVTADGNFVGFHVNREAIRVVARNGDGYVPRE